MPDALAKPSHITVVCPVGQQLAAVAAGPLLPLLRQLACRRLLVVLWSGLLAEGLGIVLAVPLVLQMSAGGRAAAAAWPHVLRAVRARG